MINECLCNTSQNSRTDSIIFNDKNLHAVCMAGLCSLVFNLSYDSFRKYIKMIMRKKENKELLFLLMVVYRQYTLQPRHTG